MNFITLGYKPILFYFGFLLLLLFLFVCSDCSRFGHWKLSVGSYGPPSRASLFSSNTSCSRFILYIPCPVLKSAISPRRLGCLFCRMVSATKIWVLGVLLAFWSLSADRVRKSCVCTNSYV